MQRVSKLQNYERAVGALYLLSSDVNFLLAAPLYQTSSLEKVRRTFLGHAVDPAGYGYLDKLICVLFLALSAT